MKKLIFYSDQIIGKTDKLDEELLKLVGKQKPRLAYIPSGSDPTRKYFNQKVEYYRRLGINNFLYFDIDDEYDPNKTHELLSCDVIHMSGGDTAHFLSNIKKRGLQGLLKEYAVGGGVLVGVSAGSIIMTETIEVIGVGREKEHNHDDLRGLGLVGFEFWPHWDRGIYNIEDFKKYTLSSGRPLYICKDSDGIVVKDNNIICFGDIIKLENGAVEVEIWNMS